MPKFAVYEATEVVISAPIPITDGLAEDNFLRVIFPERFATIVGCDSRILRYAKLNQLAQVELRLKGFSPHNQELSAMHIADVTRNDGSGVGGFLVRDETGVSTFSAARSWVTKLPDLQFGEQREDVLWTFACIYIPEGCIIGGNGTPL